MSMALPRAKKHLGQHFLVDAHYIGRIVAAIAPQADDPMVEIGPGPGALTRPLLQTLRHLHVVELDADMVAELGAACSPARLTLHRADALGFDFAALAAGRPAALRVVGNLPYNISTPLLFHLAGQAGAIRDMTFMLQKEVVDRIVAAPDTPAYGRLSVMLQARFAVTRLFVVPPGAFVPPPKVDSAIVRLVPRAVLPYRDPRVFGELVARAFGQRRKTLRNALKGLVDEPALAALGLDPARRGETLTVAQFVELANRCAQA